MSNQYIIEWSETAGTFHVHTPEEMFEKNLRAFYNRLKLDWQPIAVAADFDEACKIIKILERRRRKFLPEVLKEKLERILHRASLLLQKPVRSKGQRRTVYSPYQSPKSGANLGSCHDSFARI